MIILFANLLCVLLTYLIEKWISPGLTRKFTLVYSLCPTREITVFVMLQQQMKYTPSKTKIKENH